ncbi:MAG: xylulokinase [Candidatus Poribacteria bacterium]
MGKNKSCFMSIDLSTTACKVLVFDPSGIPVAESHCDMPLFYPKPSWIEADANDWWDITVKCIHKVLDKIPSSQITSIGVCGLMHALVPVDRLGNPLDRVMLWMDQRCKPQCEWIKEKRSDYSLPTYLSAPKLRWLVENKPDVVAKTYKFMFGKDFIRLKLTGEFATDESDAGGSALFDHKRKLWSDEMLNLIEISVDKMLPIKKSTEIAGYVTESSAKETGLRAGTPVVIGASDVRSTLIGVNIYVPKRVCLYMGTAAWVAISDEKGMVNWGGATATFGVGLRWCNELFDNSMTYSEMVKLAENVFPASDGLIFFPHLMGERWPKFNSYAKGTIFGLTLSHRKKHIIRAILEGNAYLIRQIIESYGIHRIENITATGGGAKSNLWLQIIADVIGKTISVPKVTEATALGSAILSAVGIGFFDSLDDAIKEWVHIHDCCFPDKSKKEIYDNAYKLYCQIDNALEEFYPKNLN